MYSATIAPAFRRRIRFRGRGIGLIELALAIGIGALMVAGAVLYFMNANAARKADETVKLLTAIQQAVYSLYAGQPDYAGLETDVVANSSQLASKHIKGTGTAATIINPYGGAMRVFDTNSVGTTGASHFTININTIAGAGCLKLATMDFGNTLTFRSVQGPYVVQTNGEPIPPALAGQLCAVRSNNVSLTFK